MTASRRGTLVLCEDSTGDNYLRGLSTRGQLWNLALNRLVSSTGTPRSNTAAGTRGVSPSVTELGPPDRMTPTRAPFASIEPSSAWPTATAVAVNAR